MKKDGQSRWVPAYETIAESFRRKIRDGDLKGGDKLPSERNICSEWQVSTITARGAIDQLRSEGLVYSIRGKGTFVRKETPLIRDAPRRWWRAPARTAVGLSTEPVGKRGRTYEREAREGKRSVEVQSESIRTETGTEVAERLNLPTGAPVMQTQYLVKMDGQPVSSSFMWEPLEITEGTAIEDPEKGPHAKTSIVARFDAIGYAINELQERLIIRQPTPEESIRLDIPPGVSVIQIEQTFTAEDPYIHEHVPVATGDIVFASDRYELLYTMEIK